jgi:Predicted membrane protein
MAAPAESTDGRNGRLPRILRTLGPFLGVGAISTLIELGSFNLLYYVAGMDTVGAKIASSAIALVNAYLGNLLWTFRGARQHRQIHEFARFLIVNTLCAILGAGLLAVLEGVLHYRLGLTGPFWLNAANVVSIGVIVILRFVLYAWWVFPAAGGAGVDRGPKPPFRRRLHNLWLEALALPLSLKAPAVAFTLFTIYLLSVSQDGSFVDEYDNILGATLSVERGQLPYAGYFSHHMPLVYLAGVPYIAIIGGDLEVFRIAWVATTLVWLVAIYRAASARIHWFWALALATMLVATTLVGWRHMLIAETLVAYAAIHALLLITVRPRWTHPPARRLVVVVALVSIPALSSASYVPLSIVLGVWLLAQRYLALRAHGRSPRERFEAVARTAGALLVPSALLALVLLVTGSFGDFVAQVVTFNVESYSRFTDDVATSIPGTVVAAMGQFFTSFGAALAGAAGGLRAQAAFAALLVIALGVLLARRRFADAGFGTALVVFGSYRSGNPENVFGDPFQRAGIYLVLVIVLAVIAVHELYPHPVGAFRGWFRRGRAVQGVRRFVAVVLVVGLAIPVYFGARATVNAYTAIADGTPPGIQLDARGGDRARAINAVTGADGRYFVGPYDFYLQLYLDGQRTSRYTFFLPWHAACDACVEELLDDLRRERPVAIAWQHGVEVLGADVDSSVPAVIALLERDYFQVPDERLAGVYFSRAERDAVERALDGAGFST